MITEAEARNLAMEKILRDWTIKNAEPVIIDEITIEKDFGWVFFYDSSRFLETKEFSDTLLGNAPIIVNKFDCSTHYTGTANETEYYIAEYENSLKSHS